MAVSQQMNIVFFAAGRYACKSASNIFQYQHQFFQSLGHIKQ
ncbi:hypothetical protein [Nitrosomonas sp.]|nr:hypothetical protein [Nitrosomonas sp.]